MVELLTITERDLRTLVDIVTVSRKDSPDDVADGLPSSMLADLLVAVGCDCVTFAGLDSARAVTWLVHGQPTGDFLGSYEGFWRNFWKCESCSFPDRTGDRRTVTAISDFYSSRQWHNTGHYADCIGPAGLEHKLQVCLPAVAPHSGPGRSVQLAFWRSHGTDFSGRERALLELLRPHLYQAYVQAQRGCAGGERLTPRQRELMRLVAVGYTNAQIGSRLGLAEGTVRKHLENVYGRLGVSSRTAAAHCAFPELFPD